MKTINLALLGFGNVGKAFARLLTAKKQELQAHFGFDRASRQSQPEAMGFASTQTESMSKTYSTS